MGNQVVKQKNEELCAAVHRGDFAACQQHLQAVQAADPGSASQVLNGLSMGMSALQLAAKMCRPDLLTLLLDARADLDVRDRTQWTALHFAARADPHAHCTDCARLLLQRGADAFAATDLGSTPLELARRSGCTACVRLLESHASLWQGCVDLSEQKLLVFSGWSRKWLVVLRDRRRNTGPSLFARGDFHNFLKEAQNVFRQQFSTPPASHLCPNCCKSIPIPDFLESFPCRHCSSMLVVPTSLQLALYDCDQAVGAMPSVVVFVPSDGLEVKRETAAGNNWIRSLLPTSSRRYGLSVCVQENGRSTALSLRFSTQEDCEQVQNLLLNPLLRGRGLALAETYSSVLGGPAQEELPTPSAPPAEDVPESAPEGPAEVPAERRREGSCEAPQTNQAPDEGFCVVCLEQPADTAVVPCGHMCGCHRCMNAIMEAERLCPVCRGTASSIMRIYRP
ncbi:unnamed protein product [Effrenium voratum]|nr:unnamed protein product [Effrenium voratum]CAJ1424740.1 unnamed protein product [Effrenium voratum]|mmetsp:Transcript_70717/g.168812  ORF Transcript_70717/g.168812 Transcript_70717/m.168812 type:complete len:451 (+) Transcript_70717:62-1414(+)